MRSHPTRVRGLKERLGHEISELCASHPTRVRGLKDAVIPGTYEFRGQSHPTRVRGLKVELVELVALFLRRTLRGCVD
ncbi:Uncharacterised protein [Paenibacillus macerans]|nr:Uncharacterised protein [Paenibacillus macerans]